MARTIRFGDLETTIRRDLLKDDDMEKCRWSVFQVMAAMNRAVVNIVSKINSWAGFDQDTMRRIYNVRTEAIDRYCSENPSSLSERTVYEVGEESYSPLDFVTYLRGIQVPIDDRYADAISYLAASYLCETNGGDVYLSSLAGEYMARGLEAAQR